MKNFTFCFDCPAVEYHFAFDLIAQMSFESEIKGKEYLFSFLAKLKKGAFHSENNVSLRFSCSGDEFMHVKTLFITFQCLAKQKPERYAIIATVADSFFRKLKSGVLSNN
ncbi:MAG: hypothetical protein LBN11_05115 [Tannerella sp.]|jgi:hypothetical protein|nr:hypothetical protein [Tannerella sp.]